MARLLLDAICNGDERHARDLILDGTYGCVDSQTSRRDGTALFFCCSKGYLQLTQMLLSRGASVHAVNKNGATPLHAAADQGLLDIVKLLIRHNADVNAQTHRGDGPLHLAAYRGHTEVSRCLVEAGADPRQINHFRLTPENEARSCENQEVSEFLRAVDEKQHPDSTRNARTETMIHLDPPIDLNLAFEHSSQNNVQRIQPKNPPNWKPNETNLNANKSQTLSRQSSTYSSPTMRPSPQTAHETTTDTLKQSPTTTLSPVTPYFQERQLSRRPSSCSNSSWMSETSGGSDIISIGSDASSGYWECRRDDTLFLENPHSQRTQCISPPVVSNTIPKLMATTFTDELSNNFTPRQESVRRHSSYDNKPLITLDEQLPSFNDFQNIENSANFSMVSMPSPKYCAKPSHFHSDSSICSGSSDLNFSSGFASRNSFSSLDSIPGRTTVRRLESANNESTVFYPGLSKTLTPTGPNIRNQRIDRSTSMQGPTMRTDKSQYNIPGYTRSVSIDSRPRFGSQLPDRLETLVCSNRLTGSKTGLSKPETFEGIAMNVRPDFNRSLSIEAQPRYSNIRERCDFSGRSSNSNDLSHPSKSPSISPVNCSLHPSVPMTHVNIPLN